jgi:hypothetical protein
LTYLQDGVTPEKEILNCKRGEAIIQIHLLIHFVDHCLVTLFNSGVDFIETIPLDLLLLIICALL